MAHLGDAHGIGRVACKGGADQEVGHGAAGDDLEKVELVFVRDGLRRRHCLPIVHDCEASADVGAVWKAAEGSAMHLAAAAAAVVVVVFVVVVVGVVVDVRVEAWARRTNRHLRSCR